MNNNFLGSIKQHYKSRQSTFKNSSTLPLILVNSIPVILCSIIFIIYTIYDLLINQNGFEGITYKMLLIVVLFIIAVGRASLLTLINLITTKTHSKIINTILVIILNTIYEIKEVNKICAITGIGVQYRFWAYFTGEALNAGEFTIVIILMIAASVFVVVNTVLVIRNKIQTPVNLVENESKQPKTKSKAMSIVRKILITLCIIITLISPYIYYRMTYSYNSFPSHTIYRAMKEYIQSSIELKENNKAQVTEFKKYESDEYVIESLKERYSNSEFRVINRSYSGDNTYESDGTFTFEVDGWKTEDESTVHNFTLTVQKQLTSSTSSRYEIVYNDDYFLIEQDKFQSYKDELNLLAGTDFTDLEITGEYIYHNSEFVYSKSKDCKLITINLTYYTDYTNEDDFNTAFWEGNEDYTKYYNLQQSFNEIWEEDEDSTKYTLTITAINKDTGEVINTKEHLEYTFSVSDISKQEDRDSDKAYYDMREVTNGLTIY